eukprot:GHUV01054135.1.p2 GENE.GHUV01054135.1~~GHUV01054135.1.p2  ORF type:complete len:119 (-),score=18.86 GHUV01054135.1:289-645(-)
MVQSLLLKVCKAVQLFAPRPIVPSAGKVYHMAEVGAMSEPVRPVGPDGSPDTDVMSRLAVRHDDSLENVANRLALWDRQVNKAATPGSQRSMLAVCSTLALAYHRHLLHRLSNHTLDH